MNPIAVLFWSIGGLVGYLFGESLYSVVVGLTITMSVSFLVSLKR